jgi:hypothetical protein
LPEVLAVNSDEATAAVSNADYALQKAFASISDAENAGANVSALMARLTEAGKELTAGMAALSSGNYSDSVDHANTSLSLSNPVSADAVALKEAAIVNASTNWWTMLSFSVIGSVVFVGLLFVIWSRFKRFYKNRFLRSRLEVKL